MRLASASLLRRFVSPPRTVLSRPASILVSSEGLLSSGESLQMPSVTRRSPSASPPPPKRQKLGHEPTAETAATLTPPLSTANVEFDTQTEASSKSAPALNYRDGVMLAPMVRSGTLPSRLLALMYGADLVWGPEIVDRGMIGSSRVVDEETGVISYMKAGKPVWSTHPIEKPYLIYQIGSASPDFAAQSALIVAQDVSGVELNCGCPKPFSTHAGMGANLLSTPDLLCDILLKLRASLPPTIAVSAKIRLLPSQEDTLALVRRIVATGINCLTIHCRTKDMRKRDAALIHRLRELVECVEDMGLGIPVIANGDCSSRDDAVRLRDITGAHSVMIATAAERNLSCFTPGRPLIDAETKLAPTYFALARYLKNPWGNSKHCLAQFTSPPRPSIVRTPAPPINGSAITAGLKRVRTKDTLKDFKQRLSQAKDYDVLADLFTMRGEDVLQEVKRVLAWRGAPMGSIGILGTHSSSPCALPSNGECEKTHHHVAALDPPPPPVNPQDQSPTDDDYVTSVAEVA